MKIKLPSRIKSSDFYLYIENQSAWPDWFVNAVVKYSLAMLSDRVNDRPRCDRTIQIKSKLGSSTGYATYKRINVNMSRKPLIPTMYPYADGYSRYKWITKRPVYSHAEMFVVFVAHEISHWYQASPYRVPKLPNGNDNNAKCESIACRESHRVLVAWRRDRFKVLRSALAKHRKKQKADRQRQLKDENRRRLRNSTEFKLQQAEKKLAEWEMKERKAKRFQATYRRKIRSLNAAITRKRNAKNEGSQQ